MRKDQTIPLDYRDISALAKASMAAEQELADLIMRCDIDDPHMPKWLSQITDGGRRQWALRTVAFRRCRLLAEQHADLIKYGDALRTKAPIIYRGP